MADSVAIEFEMIRPPYQTVLFDLDGTLLDTIGMIVESMRHSVQHHLGYAPSGAQLVAGVGTPLLGQVRAHAHRQSAQIPESVVVSMAATYITHNRAIHDATVSAYPGVGQGLEQLKSRGARLAIVTSKPVDIATHGLRICGLDRFFEVVIGSDSVVRHKPDPEPVYAALKALSLPKTSVVFVGDSPHDMHSGRNAGVSTAAAMWGPFAPEALESTAPTYWLEAANEIGLL